MRNVIVVAALAIAGFIFAGMTEGAVEVTDTGWRFDKDEAGDARGDAGNIGVVEKGSKSFHERLISFDTGAKVMHLRYRICTDPDHLESGQEAHGMMSSLGMRGPGWFHQGFFDVLLNGNPLGNYKAEIEVNRGEDESAAVYTWSMPEAEVKARFTARVGDDKLFMNVEISPRAEIESVVAVFRCYPSSFAGGYSAGKDNRDRWIATPEREVQHGETIKLGSEEYWVLYYDKIWERGVKEGSSGPNALLYVPIEPEAVEVNVGNYNIDTTFEYSPCTREMNFLIWNGIDKTNAEALEMMKAFKLE